MPFLGVEPTQEFASVAKQTITGTGATAYSLNHSVASANDLAVFVNNVRQEPTSAYTASGGTITFTSALASTDSCYIVYIARTFSSVAVETEASSIGIAELNVSDGTSGQALTTDGSGTLSFATTSPSANSIGITELNVSDGSSGQALTTDGSGTLSFATPGGPTIQAVASGTLANGETVIINSDGTVSGITETPFAGPTVVGTPEIFNTGTSTNIKIAYDSNAQKVVVVYRDSSNSSYGTAVVGTVSGTSISFGTPVVFNSYSTYYPAVVYDSNAQKVVIAYSDGSNSSYGIAVVGTVSGTSISFGTAVVFEDSTTSYISSTYDSNAQKIVIAYRGYPTAPVSAGQAVVGTVSGTSISFGTPVVFQNNIVYHTASTYDSNAQKVVIAYRDNGNSYYGTAVVGTVSGTSISFGTPVVFDNSGTASYPTATYDSNAQKIVIAYNHTATSNSEQSGKLVIVTVSGTSISYSTPAVFDTDNSNYPASTYDSNAQKIVIAYLPQDSGGYSAKGVVIESLSSGSTLTSENYIGISNAAYSNAATATIQIVSSIDDAQSGLTPGQKYYIQKDGSLALTASTPEVIAGTAISSTKLIVKG